MKVAIATVQVPFISGGAEIHAASLKRALIEHGAEAEIITIPFKWYPPERLLDCMLMARLMDLTEVNGQRIERMITLKFPAYYAPHPNKVAWILHQHRQAYELFNTTFGDLQQTEVGQTVAEEIRRWDTHLILEHRKIFTNSLCVSERLDYYCGIRSEPLYHPPGNAEHYYPGEYQPYILYPGRFDAIKRQHTLVEAMRLVKSEVKLVLIGSTDSDYGRKIIESIKRQGLSHRVEVRGIVSEKEKFDLYANCLAVYNGVYEEDYGYLTLEGFLAEKPVITHTDSGGPLEFVEHEENGFVIPPDSAMIAEVIDRLTACPQQAREFGRAGKAKFDKLGIHWGNVIERLLS